MHQNEKKHPTTNFFCEHLKNIFKLKIFTINKSRVRNGQFTELNSRTSFRLPWKEKKKHFFSPPSLKTKTIFYFIFFPFDLIYMFFFLSD